MTESPMEKTCVVLSKADKRWVKAWAKKRSIGIENRRLSGGLRQIIALSQEAEELGGLDELIRQAREGESR